MGVEDFRLISNLLFSTIKDKCKDKGVFIRIVDKLSDENRPTITKFDVSMLMNDNVR